jgi:hypothetical protein
MGVFYETIPDSLVPWIKEQQMLWVYVHPHHHLNIVPPPPYNPPIHH